MKISLLQILIATSIFCVAIAVWQLDLFAADWRHGDGICPLHNQPMQTRTVYSPAVTMQFSPDYFLAREESFPFCGIEYSSDFYGDKRGKIYVCPQCEKARQAWLEK